SRLCATVATGNGKAVPLTLKVIIVRAATLESVPAGPAASEVEKPRPEAGELLVRVASASGEIHHPDLIKPFRGEVYFAGDPVIPVDFVGPKIAAPSLQADTVRHEDSEDIAAHGFGAPFNTALFDFVLKTRTSP